MRGAFLPTRASKKSCFILMGTVILLYLITNNIIGIEMDAAISSFLYPALWIALIMIVMRLRKGQEKSKLIHRNTINLWAFNFGIIYVFVSILAGLFDGFGKSPYSHSIIGTLTNVLLVFPPLFAREFVRNYIVNNAKKNNTVIVVLVILLLTITGIPVNFYKGQNTFPKLVEFLARFLGPEFSKNLFATYITYLGGLLPSILYLSIIEAFHWFSPLLPDLKWITVAFIGILCPFFSLLFLQSIEEGLNKIKFRKKKDNPISWFIIITLSIGVIWFTVGVFPIYPSVIASGSMEPMIYTGDVILIQKIDGNEAQVGDVIQFQREDILVSHRVIDVKDPTYEKGKSYITKGDNNSSADGAEVLPETIKGKVVKVIPKIGWPTLLLKQDKDVSLEEIAF